MHGVPFRSTPRMTCLFLPRMTCLFPSPRTARFVRSAAHGAPIFSSSSLHDLIKKKQKRPFCNGLFFVRPCRYYVNGSRFVGTPYFHRGSLTSSRKLMIIPRTSPRNYGGGSWIRTSEVSDNRFTVCPLWPLGNSPWSW